MAIAQEGIGKQKSKGSSRKKIDRMVLFPMIIIYTQMARGDEGNR